MGERFDIARIWLIAILVVGACACTSTPPTIAHTHIGHAITAFDGTPGEKGLFTEAEARADEALRYANQAVEPQATMADMKRAVDQVMTATVSEDYGLRKALVDSQSHITFAADSADASANVKDWAVRFASGVDEVVGRCDLIALLANDVRRSGNESEIRLLSARIRDLADANVNGGASATGAVSAPGTHQLRTMLDAMIDGEDPRYVTVERWYLFHLVRLPNCDNCWAWRKWANSSNRGY